jgi:tetratricopeptide (TPR) repeat protein
MRILLCVPEEADIRTLPLFLACLSLAMAASTAQAAGGGGGGGGGGDDERVANDVDYKAAMTAVKGGQWQQVIAPTSAYVARNPGDADAWNELTHAYRMTGDLDTAFRDYAKALKIDPKHRNAREYLGEAYLQAGDPAVTEAELHTLDSLCFLPGEQYSDLKDEAARYKAALPPLASR